jgi:hypothetical protein
MLIITHRFQLFAPFSLSSLPPPHTLSLRRFLAFVLSFSQFFSSLIGFCYLRFPVISSKTVTWFEKQGNRKKEGRKGRKGKGCAILFCPSFPSLSSLSLLLFSVPFRFFRERFIASRALSFDRQRGPASREPYQPAILPKKKRGREAFGDETEENRKRKRKGTTTSHFSLSTLTQSRASLRNKTRARRHHHVRWRAAAEAQGAPRTSQGQEPQQLEALWRDERRGAPEAGGA